jgi:hypothetical protein
VDRVAQSAGGVGDRRISSHRSAGQSAASHGSASGVWIAFGFGLLHGFGFANVLSEVGAEGEPVLRTLLGFNLGVELGQLAIVAVFLPVAYLMRGTRFYRTGILYGGSSAAAACAMVWLWQRAL